MKVFILLFLFIVAPYVDGYIQSFTANGYFQCCPKEEMTIDNYLVNPSCTAPQFAQVKLMDHFQYLPDVELIRTEMHDSHDMFLHWSGDCYLQINPFLIIFIRCPGGHDYSETTDVIQGDHIVKNVTVILPSY